MADADVAITAGAGTKIDTRTVGAGTDEHRQVIVVGDPATATEVAAVTAANGLDVDVTRMPSSATATRSAVASAAADTLILASNAARKGAAITNDDANDLYLALGTAAASLTDYTTILRNDDYYEVPFGYTGQIRGIWVADGSGSARITELT